MPMEHVNIHQVLQVVADHCHTLTSQFVSHLDGLEAPVCPEDVIFMDSYAEWVGQSLVNQNLK